MQKENKHVKGAPILAIYAPFVVVAPNVRPVAYLAVHSAANMYIWESPKC